MQTKTPLTHKLIKVNADTLTAIGIFSCLQGKKKFLLESSSFHNKSGQFSFIGADPYQEIMGTETNTSIINYLDQTKTISNEPVLSILRDILPKIEVDLPFSFIGGCVGYIGYDAIRTYEQIGRTPLDELNMPEVHLMVYKNIIVLDHSNDSAYLLAMNPNLETEVELDERLEKMQQALTPSQAPDIPAEEKIDFKPGMDKETFIHQINTVKKHIASEDVSQVVLSQRMRANMNGDPFSYYRKLRRANPSPYMFYIDFDDYVILGASPESLVKTTGEIVMVNPIAGTKPRGNSAVEDDKFSQELLSDEKEVSEHNMLVDLSKKDLNRICDMESITTPVYKQIEKYEHVMHMVSEVRGRLKSGCSSIDALTACLPAGTVSGTPKQRAMQIINQLEDKKRGVYGGGIGYIGFNHDLNMALAIRSLVIKEGTAYLQTGAGIVADSIPTSEYDETLNKARSLIEANNYT